MSEPMTQCQRVARIVAELLSYPDAAWREKRAELEAAIQTVDDESMAAVLNAFVEGVDKAGLNGKVTVTQTGCIGICQFEPVVEIFEAGKDKVTYVKMTAEKAAEVVEKHLKGGKVVTEYTINGFKA